jgi:hypothetical protein
MTEIFFFLLFNQDEVSTRTKFSAGEVDLQQDATGRTIAQAVG